LLLRASPAAFYFPRIRRRRPTINPGKPPGVRRLRLRRRMSIFYARSATCVARLDHHTSTVQPRARIRLRALTLTSEAWRCWLRNGSRASGYEKVFRDRSPAPFVERVPMVKGRWEPDASTARSYAWFVWERARDDSTPVFWIPPGCRERLTRPDHSCAVCGGVARPGAFARSERREGHEPCSGVKTDSKRPAG
jgi:hypothetical protein